MGTGAGSRGSGRPRFEEPIVAAGSEGVEGVALLGRTGWPLSRGPAEARYDSLDRMVRQNAIELHLISQQPVQFSLIRLDSLQIGEHHPLIPDDLSLVRNGCAVCHH